MPRPTLFRLLVQERCWDNWVVFCEHFEETAWVLSKETNSPRLAGVTVGRRTFDRWFRGDWYGRPHRETARVLDRMLGFSCAELFAPAPDVLNARKTVHDKGGLQASLVIGQRWPTSRLFLSAAEDVADSWELTGRNVLDGTTAAVYFLPATRAGGEVSLRPPESASLERFLRPARRGLLVGVEEQGDDLRLYVIDSTSARRSRAAFAGRGGELVLSAAHELDDMTYGILWSLVQLDDGLLADDQALHEEQEVLDTYLSLPRSAPSRMTVPVFTSVGANWLGSAFCAQHIQRRLEGAMEPPLFWTREQTGEESAAWLFFRHKTAYLQAIGRQFGGAVSPLARTFCIPEAEVARTSPYERIVLFLVIALMEMCGIRVHVTVRPEYSAVDGFALVPGQRAVVANWVRTEALWRADTTTVRAELRGYQEVFNDAAEQSVLNGSDPETRLRALAGYLELDWGWLVRRARGLGECGLAGLIRPRSRLLSIDALDDVLRFLGALVPDR
ncbi:MAG: transcriptional regulator, XRE family protein [Streptomycetaceae bacterium]|nr:transcriptional regulator, XRE family protein [Streptomycetaceae bacterium]